jgi:protein-L-isoaspartate O-methyltransferase
VSTALDRTGFVPSIIWVPTGSGYRAVDRSADPAGWAAAVEADEPVVTQVDDGTTPVGRTGRSASSSSSQPSVVAAMLDSADLRRGHAVLEIGTGTGWTAGILAKRLGSAAVVTIEVDPDVADQARSALAAAGLSPLVVTGDGERGYALRAPYDRVLATCAVDEVPWSWVEQTPIGGMVVTPWGTTYHNGMLAKLVRTGPLRGDGAFNDVPMAFMRLRSQRAAECPWVGDGPGEPTITYCELGSEDVYEMIAPPGAFVIGLVLPDCHKVVDEAELVVRLHDPTSGSWARCAVTPGASRHPVAEFGPRSLWTEATAARSWWIELGRPDPTRFGLTVTPHGQELWVDGPGRLIGG